MKNLTTLAFLLVSGSLAVAAHAQVQPIKPLPVPQKPGVVPKVTPVLVLPPEISGVRPTAGSELNTSGQPVKFDVEVNNRSNDALSTNLRVTYHAHVYNQQLGHHERLEQRRTSVPVRVPAKERAWVSVTIPSLYSHCSTNIVQVELEGIAGDKTIKIEPSCAFAPELNAPPITGSPDNILRQIEGKVTASDFKLDRTRGVLACSPSDKNKVTGTAKVKNRTTSTVRVKLFTAGEPPNDDRSDDRGEVSPGPQLRPGEERELPFRAHVSIVDRQRIAIADGGDRPVALTVPHAQPTAFVTIKGLCRLRYSLQ